MKKRAAALEEVRNQIVWATIQLHSEKGIATTTQADVAARAGVSPATVYRHFPTQASLVRACSTQIWTALAPPRPEHAADLFVGLATTGERVERLVREVVEFYGRAWPALESARNDRKRVPELDDDLRMIEAGIEAFVRAALALDRANDSRVQLTLALVDFRVWRSLRDRGLAEDAAARILVNLIESLVLLEKDRPS